MASSLTLSVGIPAYNQGDFLEETIQSLLHQTRPPDEIVVSDHYSTDHTPQVIEKYAKYVRGVKPPPGVNLTGQYNFTLQSQTSDWITLLSSDDVAKPSFCEVLARGAGRQENAVLVRAGWENIDAQGKHLSLNYFLRSPKIEQPPRTILSQKNGPKVSFAAFALRRAAYLESGPILESLESLADWALFIQMAPFGSFIYEDEIVSGYRVGHDGDKFRKRLGMWVRDEQRIFAEVLPLAAQRAKMTDTRWIAESSRQNFLRYLTAADREFTPAERAPIAELFAPWAAQVDGRRQLEAFASGRPLPRSFAAILRQSRNLLRPFAQKLHAAMARR